MEVQRKYWRECLMAYLQGKKTMNWIVGVLDVGTLNDLDRLTQEVMAYGPLPRYGDIPEVRKRVIVKQKLER